MFSATGEPNRRGKSDEALPARKPGADGCFPPGCRTGAGESDEAFPARNPGHPMRCFPPEIPNGGSETRSLRFFIGEQ